MSVNLLTLLTGTGFALLLSGANVQAMPADDGVQSLARVQRAAEAALRRQLDPALPEVELSAVNLDARLRLAACGVPLDASAAMPRGSQTRVLVRVACSSPVNWNINVPVDIRREAALLILLRPIARGETIGAGDVSVQTRVLAGLASPYVSQVAELSGRVARRPLPAGTAVTADALTAALLIHRGQSVTLAAVTAGIEVRAPGLAMGDAAANQRVRVQNLNSLKIVEGVADTDSMVRVSP